ncbi:MAG: hypothetical protein KJS67_03010 [Actinomycetales bacterium]|nr:hypothetical protein [Actinomycetales bacterium]
MKAMKVMTMTSDFNLPKPPIKNPVQGAGLTKQGIVILQFALIAFVAMVEIFFRSNVGALTGISIWVAYYGALIYGRTGTTYVAVVNPPLALALAVVLLLPTVGGISLSITRFGVDLVSGLASVAPFLITGALFGWWYYFKEKKRLLSRGF